MYVAAEASPKAHMPDQPLPPGPRLGVIQREGRAETGRQGGDEALSRGPYQMTG
jgi:hypothetical protein